MLRLTVATVLTALLAVPALAQTVASPAEPVPGARLAPMNLMPPGMSGAAYNDGTREAPAPVQPLQE
jgi:hypothetical protein